MELPDRVPGLTARAGITLRPWRLSEEDLDLVRQASRDDYIPAITTVPRPYTDAEGAAFVRRQWHRTETGRGYPFVIVAPGGRPVGSVGLWLKDLDRGRASLGYWMAGSGRGRGAASAALEAVAGWALHGLAVPRLELYVEPWNTASRRTAERAGFRREGVLRERMQIAGELRDMDLYSLLRGAPPEEDRAAEASALGRFGGTTGSH
ncbi:GNAT family N-acetyltransferase [Nocardiopsis sp. RSe5-2]|uniref:GNAT family N-acetyltransferase n=1 Tax=Nocardiopsis endophytica TaxID=3018445 RepID=A0ABT4TYM7_9ACTN|nr:GNAT family N-acetyltransferase [Nocardiopsis endophytica]MDA2809782.1 GNAT family N-acetyltransferase [Nocardiopsis endophytica]